MKLAEYGEALAYEVAFWMQGLDNPEYPAAELGRLSLDLSRKLRALACMGLLVAGDSDSFHHNLIRSALARVRYLERMAGSGHTEDHHFCSGRYEPLLDAIAAGDLATARRVVQLAPVEFRAGHEYDEDYSYAQLISRWIADPPREDDVPALLGRFATATEGRPDARLEVCRALAARDQSAFDAAFAQLLEAREAEIAAAKARGQLEEPQVVALRRIFVEGLAILRLAERRGLRTEREYRYCPSSSRTPMNVPFPGE